METKNHGPGDKDILNAIRILLFSYSPGHLLKWYM